MSIENRIRKLLALADRGGTEAEAEAAMTKAYQLLAEHNLSLEEVRGAEETAEAVDADESTPTQMRNALPHDTVWAAVAKLYFCKATIIRRQAGKRIRLVGRPSNIAIVKYVGSYVTRTMQELAREQCKSHAQTLAAEDVTLNMEAWRQSFRIGFAQRIYQRVEDQIAQAVAGTIKSSDGRALTLAPLYNQERTAIDAYNAERGIRTRKDSRRSTVRSSSAYKSGQTAADGASLTSNGVSQTTRAQIA